MAATTSFANWILGVVASVIVVAGGALLATTMQLREDMAVIKATVQRWEQQERRIESIDVRVTDHEHRIRYIERDHTHTDSAPHHAR